MSLKGSSNSSTTSLSTKTPIGNRSNNIAAEATFELDPLRLHIAPHSYSYTTVTFTPASISTYTCQFEATLENIPSTVKQRSIGFDLTGDGTLPRFSVIKPTLRNKKGQTLILFKRTVVGGEDRQQLVLSNDGTLAAKVNFFLYDPDVAFKVKPANIKHNLDGIVVKESSMGDGSVASVIIQPSCQVAFQVKS